MELSDPVLHRRLLADAGPPEGAAARWLGHRTAPYADLVGPLLVPDTALTAVGRAAVAAGGVVEVAVLVSGGAGGLLAAGRGVPGVQLTAAHATLRDLDDLAANARRVIAAAGELDGQVEVGVGLPWAPGWEAAAEAVEAAGLLATVRVGPQLAAQLNALVELDLPYRVLPGDGTVEPLPLLAATWVLIEDGDVAAAGRWLQADPDAAAVLLAGAPADGAGRLRRRLRSLAVPDVAAAVSRCRWASG